MAIDYIVAKEDYDEYMKIIKSQKQEIERLNKARKNDIEYNKYLQKEIIRLNNIINEINSIVEYWGYDKEHNDISSFRMAMKNIKDILGSDKE